MFRKFHAIPSFIVYLKLYSIHILGFVAFISTFSLGVIAFMKHKGIEHENIVVYLPYGILIFFLNLFYLKGIRLSREDYEKKLTKEKEYSQALLKSQKRFLRYAAHETNTPLAVIMANIELYEMELGKHPALANIEAATKNITGIYDDLNYLAKRNKIDYHKHAIDFSKFIQSRVQFFDIVARQSDLSFKIIDLTSHVSIYFNETQLQRIIDNNITNAIKYTHEGEDITIQLKEDAQYVIFEISSCSTTIEDPEHIFDAYYREETNVEDGLGLGLNLVKRICTQENINISVNSSPDITTFTYYFTKETE